MRRRIMQCMGIAVGLSLLWAAVGWFRSFEDTTERLPRTQEVTSAVIPPTDVREQ